MFDFNYSCHLDFKKIYIERIDALTFCHIYLVHFSSLKQNWCLFCGDVELISRLFQQHRHIPVYIGQAYLNCLMILHVTYSWQPRSIDIERFIKGTTNINILPPNKNIFFSLQNQKKFGRGARPLLSIKLLTHPKFPWGGGFKKNVSIDIQSHHLGLFWLAEKQPQMHYLDIHDNLPFYEFWFFNIWFRAFIVYSGLS